MSAKVIGLDGQELKSPLNPKSEEIEKLLNEITGLNNQGQLRAVMVCAMYEDGSCANAFANSKNFPGESMIGGLELAKDLIKRSMGRKTWLNI